jgi:CheY-like chemotaxis protein
MSKKILVIDDEEQLVEMVQMRLEANEYMVISAKNGAEGVQKAVETKPDLILMDVLMPEMNGYSALKHLKEEEKTKDIPVIMFTVQRHLEDRRRSISEGAAAHIVKPFEPEELMKKIKDILAGKEQ